jgi:beta-ribofuranosylaminobenzene 5'-phosphate synthase
MTQIESLRVSAPSRLHFGLLSFGHTDGRQYGGLGVMIDQPRLVLTARLAQQIEASGPFRERAVKFAKQTLDHLGHADRGVQIEIHEAPPAHVGLGTGTQLALCVARALFNLFDHDEADASQLACVTRRGVRSAIGTHGFEQGGMIFEPGKLSGEAIAPLANRIELPSDWRFMLLIPNDTQGLSGKLERDAFEHLPPVPKETTKTLTHIATKEIFPAAARDDFDAFSDALYRYGHAAGMCFASHQAGPFTLQQTEQMVRALRAAGIQGVGQSSWGPALFALVRSDQAEQAMQLAKSLTHISATQVLLATPNNTGAVVEVVG